MIPTYVFGWPTGQETGSYLAVDLGEFLSLFAFPQFLPFLCDTPDYLVSYGFSPAARVHSWNYGLPYWSLRDVNI